MWWRRKPKSPGLEADSADLALLLVDIRVRDLDDPLAVTRRLADARKVCEAVLSPTGCGVVGVAGYVLAHWPVEDAPDLRALAEALHGRLGADADAQATTAAVVVGRGSCILTRDRGEITFVGGAIVKRMEHLARGGECVFDSSLGPTGGAAG